MHSEPTRNFETRRTIFHEKFSHLDRRINLYLTTVVSCSIILCCWQANVITKIDEIVRIKVIPQ